MCGFIGLYGDLSSTDLTLRNKIRKSLALFQNRGPDSTDIKYSNNCIIGFNRLAINNLESGNQPRLFSNQNDNISIICFNGEIFNYKELEREFLSPPYERDEIDVLIGLFKIENRDIFKLLNGQFAIVIYDANSNKLILARDHFGIRPLFFSNDSIKNRFTFGSDIRGFKIFDFQKQINQEELARLHLTWSISNNKTIWKDIYQVEPASYLEISNQSDTINKFTSRKYFKIESLISEQNKRNDIKLNNESLVEFREQFSSAVKRQIMSDVGYVSYLSGGIDSSVIAYELTKINKQLSTFSINFEDNDYDESSNQEIIVSHLNTKHSSKSISDSDIDNNFNFATSQIQQPFFRTAPIPLMLLAKLINSSFNKVAMTGEGADEILLGYDIFRENICINFVKGNPSSKWRYKVFDNLYSYLPQYKDKRIRRLAIDTLLRDGDFKILNPLKSRLNNNLRTFMTMKDSDRIVNECVDNLICEYEEKCSQSKFDDIDIIQLFEIQNLLSGYLLSSQGDRAAMSYSVETRFPYLDIDFVRYCFSIPRNHKLKGTFFKKILRKSYQPFLPKQIINSPKIAYQAPEARAILRNNSILEDLKLPTNKIYQYYDYQKIQKMLHRIGNLTENKRGTFSDNMTTCIISSLSFLLK